MHRLTRTSREIRLIRADTYASRHSMNGNLNREFSICQDFSTGAPGVTARVGSGGDASDGAIAGCATPDSDGGMMLSVL